MDSLKITRVFDGKCSKCNENAVMLIENLNKDSKEFFCAKHYAEFEGEHEIENDLQVISQH